MEKKQSEYNPITCNHKLPSGFSAYTFLSGSSGGGKDHTHDVSLCVCSQCGEVKISGYRANGDDINRFSEEFSIYYPDAVAAIVKNCNYMNSETEGYIPFVRQSPPVTVTAEDFQSRVLDWLLKCFGHEIAKDVQERTDRFIEESLELAQSLGYSADRAHALVDYVFDRDKGEPFQEVGGVMVTLAALCSATGLNMAMDGEVEYARINKPEIIEKIRKKQAAKPTGSALPIVYTQSTTIERLTKALEAIVKHADIVSPSLPSTFRTIAREALDNIKK